MTQDQRAAAKKERKAGAKEGAGADAGVEPKHGDAGACAVDGGGEPGTSKPSAPLGTAMNPTWVRGGGGRNRGSGGRHSYIDPIIPVEEKALLQPLVEYYGLKDEFPLYTQLVSRR